MATEPLIKVSCVSKGEKIGLTNYSDLVVFDKEKTIVALRIGGYPETVQAMSDIIITGCDLELEGASETIEVNTKGQKNYERRLSHDGIYAEGMHYLKDDVFCVKFNGIIAGVNIHFINGGIKQISFAGRDFFNSPFIVISAGIVFCYEPTVFICYVGVYKVAVFIYAVNRTFKGSVALRFFVAIQD